MKKNYLLTFCLACFFLLWSCSETSISPFNKKWQKQFEIRLVNSSHKVVKNVNVYLIDTKDQYSNLAPRDTILGVTFENISELDTSEVKTINLKDKSKIGYGYLYVECMKNDGKEILTKDAYQYNNFFVAEPMDWVPSYMEIVVRDSSINEIPEIYVHQVTK